MTLISHGEYMYLAPSAILHRISAAVPAEAAVLANAVISNGIQWVRTLGGASVGQAVVIQGVGGSGFSYDHSGEGIRRLAYYRNWAKCRPGPLRAGSRVWG